MKKKIIFSVVKCFYWRHQTYHFHCDFDSVTLHSYCRYWTDAVELVVDILVVVLVVCLDYSIVVEVIAVMMKMMLPNEVMLAED